MIGGDSKTGIMVSSPASMGFTSQSESGSAVLPAIRGVKILGFRPGSKAREAGMQKGDVIIECDGEGNLTTDSLLARLTMPRPEAFEARVVFLRNGDVLSVTLPQGPLGASVADIAVDKPLKNPKLDSELRTKASVGRIVKFMRTELSQGTDRGTLRRTLVANGWDEAEAVLFVEQVVAEMAQDRGRARATPEWYEEIMQWLGLFLLSGWLWYEFHAGCYTDAVFWGAINILVTGGVLIWSLRGWLAFRKHLKRLRSEEAETEALSFKPTKGNLRFTERCRTPQEVVWDILLGTRIIALLLMAAALVFTLIYGLIFH